MAFIINGSASSADVLAPSASAVGMVGGTAANNVSHQSPPNFGPNSEPGVDYHHYHHYHQTGNHVNNGNHHPHYHYHHSSGGDQHYRQADAGSNNHPSGQHRRQPSDGHVTVLQIEQKQTNNQLDNQHQQHQPHFSSFQMHNGHANGLESDFVTVLQIAPPTSTSSSHQQYQHHQQKGQLYMDNRRGEIEEEVTIYRLPGERLGMALRFDGGADSSETIRRVFVQSITENSPASKAIGLLLGVLRDGDEILQIEGRSAASLTRIECITLLKDAPVRIRLLVRRVPQGAPAQTSSTSCNDSQCCCPGMANGATNGTSLPPCCQMSPHESSASVNSEAMQTIHHNGQHFANGMEMHSYNGDFMQRKVPPPVPPRMATTTLSSRRKAKMQSPPLRHLDIDQLEDSKNASSESMTDAACIATTTTGNIVFAPECASSVTSSPPVEKPPRRKNILQSLTVQSGPPPLPPRRPKGPPPKPPTTTSSSSSNIISVVNSAVTVANTIMSTANTKSLPSLVAVITTKVNDGVVSSTSSQSTSSLPLATSEKESTSIGSLTTPSVTSSSPSSALSNTLNSKSNKDSSAIKTSATSKVTFTISNSKVSSFIRNTAEKLHRKLSGKSNSNSSNTAEHEEESGTGKQKHSKPNQNSEKEASKSLSKSHSVRVCVPSSSPEVDQSQSVVNFLPVEIVETTSNTNQKLEEQKEEKAEPVLNTSSNESQSQSLPNMSSVPSAAAVYIDCQDMDSNSIFESDTDDTSSSVSTIIERGSSLSNAIFDSLAPHFEQNSSVYFSGQTSVDSELYNHDQVFKSSNLGPTSFNSFSSSSSCSIVDRVLSPFERLEREFDAETAQQQQQQQTFSSLSSFASSGQSLYVRPVNDGNDRSTFRSLSFLSKQSITDDDHQQQQPSQEDAVPLSPDKTSALIDSDERLVPSTVTQVAEEEAEMLKSDDGETVPCTIESQSCIPVDTASQRDYKSVEDYSPAPPAADEKESAQSNLAQSLQEKKLETIEANETMITSENGDRQVEQVVPSGQISSDEDEEDDEDDDDEDFDVIKNDIISRVDDDKDDFMLDTNYLKESSSRYLFHHSGSELILAPYSELSSITEEDEEEEAPPVAMTSSNLTFDNKRPSTFTSNFQTPVEVSRLPVTVSAGYDKNTTTTTNNSNSEVDEEGTVESKAVMNPTVSVASPDWTLVEEKSSEISLKLPAAKTADSPVNNGHSSTAAVEEPLKDDIGSQSPSADEQKALPEEHHRSTSSNSSSSSTSSSSSPKVSLNNVFDFLNEAADDFEFVERMLELTNDNNRVDSIDDIMRIRESLRGLQQSVEQRDHLQRFLDGKDVIDELMALSTSTGGSSPTHSSAPSMATSTHSTNSVSPVLSDMTEGSDRLVMAKLEESYRQHQNHQNHGRRQTQMTRPTAISATNKYQRMMGLEMSEQDNHDDFVSLPLTFAPNGHFHQHNHRGNPMQCNDATTNSMMHYSTMYRDKCDPRRLSNGNLSKIPTLTPKLVPAPTSSALSRKRSQSVSNIFQQRNSGYNSLIEMRPSLIPRPISNFNLSLPPTTTSLLSKSTSNYRSGNSHVSHHNCLNRSTSMQSIPTSSNSHFNSLGRPMANKNNGSNRTPVRRSSVSSQLNGSANNANNHNYHQHCHRNVEPSQSGVQYYGSLSRSISKSTANVYSTGSLPRPAPKPVLGYYQQQQQQLYLKQSSNLGASSNLSSSQYGNSNCAIDNNHLRTSSLVDLTYGFSVSNNKPRQVEQQQYSLATSNSALPVKTSLYSASASRRHSSSSNLQYLCESIHSGEEASSEHSSLHLQSTPLSKFNSGKLPNSHLQTSSSLVSLLPPPPPVANSSHFWHCAHHASSNSLLSPNSSHSSSEGSKSKRSFSSNNLNTLTKAQRITTANQNQISAGSKSVCKVPSRKSSSSKSLSSSSNSYTSSFSPSSASCSSSSSSSKSSSAESDDQQVPTQQLQQQQQTRSILRHSCVNFPDSKYQNNKSSYLRVLQLTAKDNNEGKKELDYWKQNIADQRKRQVAHNYDLSSSHSDSESSDITNSSGDTEHCQHQHTSAANKTWQQAKSRRNKVCFVDEIVQHPSGCSDTGDIDYRRSTAATEKMEVATANTQKTTAAISAIRQMRSQDEEPSFEVDSSSSPEVPVVLSSSTSSSSIASFSSGDLGKVCIGSSRPYNCAIKEALGNNSSLSKSFYLPLTTQREDSGIFNASDDTSTSEFSQSPSPELLIGGNHIKLMKAHQENGEMEMDTPSMKERIAFFDPANNCSGGSNNHQQPSLVDLSRSYSCNKSLLTNGNSPVNGSGNLINGGILSRSSSAPYETHCELGTKLSQSSTGEDLLLTPPQSPPNERSNLKGGVTKRAKRPPPPPPPAHLPYSLEQHIGSMNLRVETTAYPVTVEYSKKPAVVPFQSLRDSAITARRFANTCKLKGLVIPQSIIPVHEEESSCQPEIPRTATSRAPVRSLLSMNVTESGIDLPTIISEETLKVKSSKVEELSTRNSVIDHELQSTSEPSPIEFVAHKQADSSVPKYSPMFKRRPLSLPLHPEINYGPPKTTAPTVNKTVQSSDLPPPPLLPVNSSPKLPPPAVPPKPKVSPLRLEDVSPISKVDIVELPKMEDTKKNVVSVENVAPTSVVDETPETVTIPPPSTVEIVEEVKTSVKVESEEMEQTVIPSLPLPSPSSILLTPTETPTTNEFVIHQRQYSMRAIVFDLTELPDLPLGISLTGGLDALNKEVMIEQIEPNSVASQDGRLQQGDRIVSINGKLLLGLTHEETEGLLESAAHSQQVMIVFSRTHEANGAGEVGSPSPSTITSPSILGSMSFPTNTNAGVSSGSSPSTRTSSTDLSSGSPNYKILKAEIIKDVNGLGFIIEGGKNPSIEDRPLIIKRIFRGGPVDKEGTLVERDELLSINDQSVQGMSRSEAWQLLKQLPDGKVTLVTRRKRYF